MNLKILFVVLFIVLLINSVNSLRILCSIDEETGELSNCPTLYCKLTDSVSYCFYENKYTEGIYEEITVEAFCKPIDCNSTEFCKEEIKHIHFNGMEELNVGDQIIFEAQGLSDYGYCTKKFGCEYCDSVGGVKKSIEEKGSGIAISKIIEEKSKTNKRSFAIGYVLEDIGEDDNYFPLFEIIVYTIILAIIVALLIFGYTYYKKKNPPKK
ncbi:MAG: hypothetical protein ABIE23_03500 [archaeon]